MQLLKGLSVAVLLLAMALGVMVGLNGRADSREYEKVERSSYEAAYKRGKAAADDEAYPLGLKDGMEQGNRDGRRKGKADGLADSAPTGATGTTPAVGETGGETFDQQTGQGQEQTGGVE